MKIVNNSGLGLIATFEGLSLKPYLCPANVPTIGYGNTFYEDGTKVKMSDPAITKERAFELLKIVAGSFAKKVDDLIVSDVNQNQFNALVSFAYNCGVKALAISTLLKKVNANPNDPSIAREFAKWNKAGGRVLKGLVKRRQAEIDMYFS